MKLYILTFKNNIIGIYKNGGHLQREGKKWVGEEHRKWKTWVWLHHYKYSRNALAMYITHMPTAELNDAKLHLAYLHQ